MTDLAEEQTSPDMDYAAHEATWKTFLRLSKWTIGVIAVILIALYFIVIA
jgi:hypothetical protein